MLAILAEAALRSFVLGGAVWLALKALRVHNPHVQMTCWIVVLAASLAMPLLMHWTHLTITVPSSLATVQETLPPAQGPLTGALRAPLPEALPIGRATTHSEGDPALDWWAIALAAYAGIAGLLVLRLALGLALTRRLARAAAPIRAAWADGSDVRVSDEVGGPVTFGSIILLPSQYSDWDLPKRQAVLAHERAHIASHDFYLLLFAALNRALFWFSPFAWWQLRRLAELAEIIADARAIEVLEDRMSYAELLLELVQNVRSTPIALEMARGCTVPARVDRILAAVGLPAEIGWRKRLTMAAAIVPIAVVTSGTIAYRTERPPLFAVGPPGFLPAIAQKPDSADFYAIKERSVFAIFQAGDDLFGQLTGQRKLRLSLSADGTYSYPAAAGRFSFARDADRASELTLRQNGHDIQARRIGGMRRANAEADPARLDQYVGWFALNPNRVVGVTRDGSSLRLQETGRPRFEVTADSADAFSSELDDFIMFLRDGQGQVTQILLSDPIAGVSIAPRIDARRANAVEEEFARRVAEVPDRFREQTPAPGSREAILRGIADMQRGTPNYERMSEPLATAIRREADQLHAMFVSLGAVESIFFRGVGPGGYDIYGVKFANGSAEFRLLLGPDGKADDVIFRPDGNGEPGGIVGCSAEASLTSSAGTAPIRILIYNNSGEDLQLFRLEADGRRTAQGTVADTMSWSATTTVGSPWVVADRSGQCREIVLPGRRTRFHTVFQGAEATNAGDPMDRAEARRTAPLAGSEDMLRHYIEQVSRGQPDYEHMSPDLAAQTRQRLPFDQAILGKLGTLRAMSFRGVTALDTDIYVAHFANGSAEWRIGLARDGTITRMALGPQY